MSIKIENIEFLAGPSDLGAPDNLETTVIDFIDKAQKKLEIAIQELQSEPITRAITEARKRKVTVKIVLEQDYLRSSRMKVNPFESGGEDEENRFLHDALLRSNIDVKVDYNTGIFHQKFIVRDSNSILTGSANFTNEGMHKNLNHLVIINDAGVAKIYSKEFGEIQKGHFGRYNEGHDPAPSNLIISDVRLRVLFAPDHNPEMEIMKQMMKAKKRIDFAIFTFAKSSGIDDTMIKLLDFGMPIKGAFDGLQGGQKWSAVHTLIKHGADLHKVPSTKALGKLHHKLMIIDDQLIIAGSFNYTSDANRINDENIIILGDLGTKLPAQIEAQGKIARYAREEIERIIGEHGVRF